MQIWEREGLDRLAYQKLSWTQKKILLNKYHVSREVIPSYRVEGITKMLYAWYQAQGGRQDD